MEAFSGFILYLSDDLTLSIRRKTTDWLQHERLQWLRQTGVV